jgi:hypothetical protein
MSRAPAQSVAPTGTGLSARAVERATLAVLAVFGILAAAASPSLGMWDANGPSSGFLPAIAGATVALCALASLFRPEMSARDRFLGESAGAMRVGAVLGAIVALAAGIPVLGFIATAVPMLTLLLVVVNRGRLLYALVVATSGAVGIHLMFEKVLDVLLPRGILGLV